VNRLEDKKWLRHVAKHGGTKTKLEQWSAWSLEAHKPNGKPGGGVCEPQNTYTAGLVRMWVGRTGMRGGVNEKEDMIVN